MNGHWTPKAAEAGCAFMAAVPSKEAIHLLEQMGGMKPSASHLDRLPRHIEAILDEDRFEFEETICRADILPPAESVSLIMASLDGVMVPMKNAPRVAGLQKGNIEPKGHKEAACASVSLFNRDGDRLHTIRFGRMPESKKPTLQRQLNDELRNMRKHYPDAKLQAVADGAGENWRIFGEISNDLKVQFENTLDYYHAMEYVAEAFKLSGGSDPQADTIYWGQVLREESKGVDSLTTALENRIIHRKGATKEKLQKTLNYIINHKDMMQYHRLLESKQPIGSGIQEAACKTLVVQRMKNSGMTWSHKGGQAILTLRGYHQSGRWANLWKALRYKFGRVYNIDKNTSRQKPFRKAA